MSYGPVKVFSVGITSGTSTSSMLDLGKSHSRLAVGYVTMSTGALVSVYGADTATGTAKPITALVPSTATVAYQNLQITTATSGSWVMLGAVPFQFVKFVTSDTVGGGASFTVLASD